jgi:myo-inositol-1(or 4)-monophosphatase
MKDYSKYLNIAIKATQLGGKILLKYYQSKLNVEFKGVRDPVSQADKESQKAIINIIKKSFPDHGIIAEEENIKDIKDKDFCWIIDPLDGTVNFVHSQTLFCVSIALSYRNEIVAGVIYAPILEELFTAQKGKGAYLNGKKISVSKNSQMIKCLAATGFPYSLNKKSIKTFNNFKKIILAAQGIRRLGSAAIDAAYTACGRLDFYWEDGIKIWDIAAGSLIVKEAGGQVSDYKGGGNYFSEGAGFVASNSIVHKQIIKILNEK